MASAINVEATLDELRRRGEGLLAQAKAKAQERGVQAETLLREVAGGRVADQIVHEATAGDCDTDRHGHARPARLQPPADRQRGRIGAAQQSPARVAAAPATDAGLSDAAGPLSGSAAPARCSAPARRSRPNRARCCSARSGREKPMTSTSIACCRAKAAIASGAWPATCLHSMCHPWRSAKTRTGASASSAVSR